MSQGARRPRVPGVLRWAVGLLVLSTISCQAALIEPEATEVPAASEAPAPAPAPSPSPAPEVEACDSDQEESIQRTISAQSEALAAGDWELAYSYASPAFRAAVTIEQFERVITRQYDMLLYFEGAEFGPCETPTPGIASVSVEVRSAFYRPVIMVYEVVSSDGSWFVNGVDVPVSATPNA